MARISKDPNGRKRIQFVDPDGNRKAIRLGKMTLADARVVLTKVEAILSSKIARSSFDNATSCWIAELPDTLADKLANVGLVPRRGGRPSANLEDFIEGYILRRTDVSPDTQRIWRQTKRKLVEHFGADKPLAEITRGDATDWRLTLVAAELADASVRKHCGFAKHFFAQALDHEIVLSNPFAKLVSSSVGNQARQYFITSDEITKVLAAAPDTQWRLIIALSRYGGLRCPSEHLSLTWGDIDWDLGRMHVTSPKTARHVGHESRVVPLFPELRPYLEAAFDEADEGTEFVITRYRDGGSNLRTQMTRIVKRAGLKPWPRIFHNLRSSRQTELEETFASHVVCAWIGNSPQVARAHYLQVTDDHFERALVGGAKSGALVAQNQAQHTHAASRTTTQKGKEEVSQPLVASEDTRNAARDCDAMRNKMAEVHGNRTHRPRGSRTAQRF